VRARPRAPDGGGLRTFLFPEGSAEPEVAFRELNGLTLEEPVPTPGLASSVARHLAAGRSALVAERTDTVLRALGEAVAEWLAVGSPDRDLAERSFSAASGVPRATAPFGPLLEPAMPGAIRDWVREEVMPLEALDGFAPRPGGCAVRALGPRLAVIVAAGNVPLAWLPVLLACLAMRTPCLVKPATEDPLGPALFAATLARRLPSLAACVGVLPWRGGDEEVEAAVLAEAGALIAFGGDAAVRSLARRVPPEVRFVARGPRFAAGVVSRESLAPGRFERVAGAMARDALLYDGRGCLSPRVVFLEKGGILEPSEAARVLGGVMEGVARELPAGRPGLEWAAVTRGTLGRLKARSLSGKGTFLAAPGEGLEWAFAFDPELPVPEPAPYRTLWATPVRDIAEVPALVRARGGRLHALAFAGPDPRRAALAASLAGSGVTLIAPFGRLQSPPLSWPNGGSSPFAELLGWTRTER